jgi:nicotinate phosphoribosyltransferase
MGANASLYGQSLALLTDLYQLTMAYGYWKEQIAEKETVFHLHFRRNPFGSGFSIACGLESVIEYLERFAFTEDDLEYLASLTGNDGQPLFERAFLSYLRDLRLACDVDAMPEGTVVFPYEPLLRVQGPVIHCQLLETALLNLINFQTLIATKAARVNLAAHGESVLEFGARRAQGVDGALTASRAAYVGGCAATSNVLAGKLFGIPVRGTHAHSWVMLFDDEREAFQAYARAMPNNCVFLVDTYNTLDGVRHAVEVGKWLRERGHRMIGVRLDSGDLAYLSMEARKILDEGGFPDATIFASNDLDETVIGSLKEQGATITVWGVGTRLVTGYDQPALGGVYKLSAVREPGSAWRSKVKISEQTAKISNPGVQQVRRYCDENGTNTADVIYDIDTDLSHGCVIIDQLDPTKRRQISAKMRYTDLLVPVLRGGRRVYDPPPLAAVREAAQVSLAGFYAGIKRFVNPHLYFVGIEQSLQEQKTQLILQARQG